MLALTRAHALLVWARHLTDRVNILLVGVLLNKIAKLGQERSFDVLQNSLVEADAKALVLILVKLDEELCGIERALVAVPLKEVLERLLVLEDGA